MKMDKTHFIKILTIKRKDWRWEKNLLKFYSNFISIDEAGRGALAGPLSLGCLYLDRTALQILEKRKVIFEDSKKLTPEKREEKFKIIKKLGIPYKKVFINNKTIDKLGINKAFIIGIKKLKKFFEPELTVVDGLKINLPETLNIVKGDALLNSLGGASIIAKVLRDKKMEKLAKLFPYYFWEKNKGYGTKEHLKAIKKYGLSPFHRQSYTGGR